MTKVIKTQEQIAEAKAKKAAYDKERRARIKAEKAMAVVRQEDAIKARKVVAKPQVKEVVKAEAPAVVAMPVKTSWKQAVNFTGAVEVTRANVKNFYKKQGFIKVEDANGEAKHIGRTTNMGKVFSNYVNCANYNQSYDFNPHAGDKLLFKEGSIV